MIAYAESSAVLAWLFDEPRGRDAGRVLAAAERVVASALTVLECRRTIRRGARAGGLPDAGALALERLLDRTAASWIVLELHAAVVDRAAQRFPVEPVRTLDALHLASVELLAGALGPLTVLSLDERVRRNAAAMGLAVPAF